MGTNNSKKSRISVSAEAYGRFNAKGVYVPVVVNKSDDAKMKYVSPLTFLGLDND